MSREKFRIRKRRAKRLDHSLGLWLARKYGSRSRYSKPEIDKGCEDLGYRGVDDYLVAYTLFGDDLAPNMAGMDASASDMAAQVSEIVRDTGDAASVLLDDELF